MELWREVLIGGLQNESVSFNGIDDKIIKEIIQHRSYKVLLEIKQIINDPELNDKECFLKIEVILSKLEENNIFCDRHDFG